MAFRPREAPQGSPALNVMRAAAMKAGKTLLRDFGEVEALQVSQKGPADFVTAADVKVEKMLREELERARPGYCFVMEEGGIIEGPDKSHRWYIDPIDGTTNFIHSLPQFAISIGLEREGQLVAGVVYAPVLNEFFWAEKGRGAWLNDKRLRVAGRKKLSECIFATGIPFAEKAGHDVFLAELATVMKRTAGVRRFGAASLDLAYVAAGRFDGFWERGLKPWDIAAGTLLVREAGGLVTDEAASNDVINAPAVIAANIDLHPELMKMLALARS
ncbi:MAG: inositol monophosphatase family protein [Alphaproteobacteria bacterium]